MTRLRPALHLAFMAAAGLSLVSCASRQPAGSAAPAAGAIAALEEAPPASRPAPLKVSTPAVPATTVPPSIQPAAAKPASPPPSPRPASTPTPAPKPQHAGDLIRNGQVESDSGGVLVVKKPSPTEQEAPGLFEDAIIQTRVRAALLAAGHPRTAETARVRGGVAELELTDAPTPAGVAKAIDAALEVAGVSKVRATGGN